MDIPEWWGAEIGRLQLVEIFVIVFKRAEMVTKTVRWSQNH